MFRTSSNLSSLASLVFAVGTIACASGCRAARGASPPPSPLVGTWLYPEDAQITSTCADKQVPARVGGATVTIRPDDGTGVWLDIGCRCHLHLTAADADAGHVRLEEPAACAFVYGTTDLAVVVQTLTLDLDPISGTLRLDLDAGATGPPAPGTCESSVIKTTLSLLSRIPRECGPDTSALGVIPYDMKAQGSCPLGAGREGLLLVSQDEADLDCVPVYTGWWGQSRWALPQTAKSGVVCKDHDPKLEPRETHQHFCRVDGRLFKPLTTDPLATEQFYAVLKLSAKGEPCPNGSVEMVRQMDTQDTMNKGRTVGVTGPNQVVVGPDGTAALTGNATILHFCFFRSADDPADTMGDFPDLGFPYAVYHDFDGPQPPWVTLKRWHRSTNERNTNGNFLSSPVPGLDPLAVAQFRELVETPVDATVFDTAWVR